VSTNTVSTFFAVGAVAIAVLVAAAVAVLVTARFSDRAAGWRDVLVVSIGDQAIRLAWLIAVAATLGSLYYSEIADFEPCRFCWYQRIAMYPLALILGIAAFTKDHKVARYVIPMASIGGGIAAYHYLIQHVPGLSTGACSTTVPCSAPWVWEFEFVSIPFMALVSFAAIIVLMSVDRMAGPEDSTSHES
jgi:disulfide bond formation protein DsbB